MLVEADLAALLELNRLRALGASGDSPEGRVLEARFERRFSAHRQLAVYGSLAPGRENHGQLGDLAGSWQGGLFVTGELIESGWGSELGYPAMRWSLAGSPVPVQLFTCARLPEHWARLDAFEGADYVRVLVPVRDGTAVVAVANLYALR